METLNYSQLLFLHDLAIKELGAIPYRCRFLGMPRDLSESDKRDLAYFKAVFTLLNQQGLLKDKASEIIPEVFTKICETIDGD